MRNCFKISTKNISTEIISTKIISSKSISTKSLLTGLHEDCTLQQRFTEPESLNLLGGDDRLPRILRLGQLVQRQLETPIVALLEERLFDVFGQELVQGTRLL